MASFSSRGEAMSIVLVSVISLTEGAEASRLEPPPTPLEIPRPTPNWKEFTSIQSLWVSWVVSPLIAPYFRKIAMTCSLRMPRAEPILAPRRAAWPV